MAIRDLGYQPYEGERLPPSHNTQVMLRHGLSRAWGSWLVRIAAFLCWVPLVVSLALVGFQFYAANQGIPVEDFDAGGFVHGLYKWQLWAFVTLVTLGAGSGAIAEDFTFKAFQFYFAKPVTVTQYLAGRISAVGIWCFLLTFVPAAMLILALVGTGPEEQLLERLGLLLPALMHSALIAAVCAIASVAVSAMSKSRALTMSAWILVFFVPHVLAFIVFLVGDWPWLELISIPALLSHVGDALFRIPPESDLRWFHALPILGAVCVGGLTYASLRLRSAEVIT